MWSVLNHCSKVGQDSSTCQCFNFLRIKSTKYPSAEKRRRVRTLDRDVSQLIWMEVYRKRQIACDFLHFEEIVWNYYLTFSLFIYLILVDLFAGLLGYICLDQKYLFTEIARGYLMAGRQSCNKLHLGNLCNWGYQESWLWTSRWGSIPMCTSPRTSTAPVINGVGNEGEEDRGAETPLHWWKRQRKKRHKKA